MGIVNPVGTFALPNSTTDDFASWCAKIDSDMAVGARLGDLFAPRPASTPNMTLIVDSGFVFVDQALTEVAAQTTPTFVAPTANSRIDRVVIDRKTAAISVVAGTASATPVAPALPTGKNPIAQVLLTSTTTAITAANIYDERALSSMGSGATAFAALGANIGTDASGNLVDNLPYQNKVASYSFVDRDRNKLTNFTLSAVATATLLASPAAGWKARIGNNPASTALLTIAGGTFFGPGLSGVTSFSLAPGQFIDVSFDGSAYRASAVGSDKINETEVSIASAATTDLGAGASHNVQVTGSNAITSFGSSANLLFPVYFLRFAAAATLTYNATSLILPGAANITTAAGDWCIALYLGFGNWRVVSYMRASGNPLLGGTPYTNNVIITSGTSWTVPNGVTQILVTLVPGGGAGGGANSSTGGGGGTCGEILTVLMAVTPGQIISLSIGAAGAGVSGNAGGNGGTTTFNGISVNGGVGGPRGGTAGQTATPPAITPQTESTSLIMIFQSAFAAPGATTSSSSNTSGAGANSPYGTGGASSSGAGNPANGYGAGGGGGYNTSSTGGNGAPGVIFIRY